MAISLEVWEDSGPLITGHGTTRHIVSNVGHKASGLDENTLFADYPITRPSPGSGNESDNAAFSYHKYTYFKIQGTYPAAAQIRVELDGDLSGVGGATGIASKVRLLYKWTNIYQEPSDIILSGSTAFHGNSIHIPMLSTVGPEDASGLVNQLATNTTYYTNYLVTQLMIDPSDLEDWGNIDLLTFKLTLHEYETTDI